MAEQNVAAQDGVLGARVAGVLAETATTCAATGVTQSQSYGRLHEQPAQDASQGRAQGAIDPSILKGLSGVQHKGSVERPVVGPQTEALAAKQGQDAGNRGRG